MDENFKINLIKAFKTINIELNCEQIEKFFDYYNLLKEWNEKINLTSIIDEQEVIYKHFVDSCVSLKQLNKNSSVLDIGTGAGFPSIPLKILNDSLNFVLVDSINKKIFFLNEVITQLKLNNIKAIHIRAEDLAYKSEYREKFDYVVSRAVSRLNVLNEYCLPFLRIGGNLIAYKSIEAEEEIKEAKNSLNILGGKIVNITDVSFKEYNRKILIIKKINKTPNKYPRGGNKPRISPIV